MKLFDLHLHSHYSDGKLSPFHVFQQAKRSGYGVVALTDHNGISGLGEAALAARQLKLGFLTGVEIYSIFQKKELHILGYHFKPNHPALNNLLNELQKRHRLKVEKILAIEEKMNFIVNRQKLNQTKSVYLGWDEIIDNLKINLKNWQKIKREIHPQADLFEIINKYFGPGQKGFVTPIYCPAEKAIKILKQAGAIIVLAHPGQQLTQSDDDIILKLKKLGIAGLEVFSPYHNWIQIMHYQRLAAGRKLMMTGGTDYHGDVMDKRLKVKKQWDYFTVPNIIYKNGLGKLVNK